MRTPSPKPTLEDVAEQAGVSLATVSRVMRNIGPMRIETRNRVMEAVKATGYRIELLAPNPRQDSSANTIALVITDLLNPFFPEIVCGVESEAAPNGFGLMIFNTSEDPDAELRVLARLANTRISGVIVCSSRVASSNLISFYENTRVPLVVINRRIDHAQIPAILVDFERSMYNATRHLLSLGHTRIAYLDGLASSETSAARRRGIELALQENGLSLPAEWCLNSFPNVDGGFQAMTSLLLREGRQRPTAVVAYNDLNAIGALHALRVHHLRVPDEMSVVGCDGINISAHTNPPLTTIDQPKFRMGQFAMQIVLNILRGKKMPTGSYNLMESPLIIRESTAPPPVE